VDRCALFVDAGYLLADGAMAVHGTRRRESVTWDYEGFLQLLGNLAHDRTGLPLLRCYWYEATVEGRRTAEHDALADMPGIKLRLAKLRPGRREGVETEIHRDLTVLARNRAVSDAVVVSAEEDLAQVLSDVQDLGLRVTIVHVTVDGNWTISRSLRQECDDIMELTSAHLRPFVDLIPGAEPARADEQYIPSALVRSVSNGHSASGAGSYQALPAGSNHSGPPSIYTAPVVAEYQRPVQQIAAQQPQEPEPRPPVRDEPAAPAAPPMVFGRSEAPAAPVREEPVRPEPVRGDNSRSDLRGRGDRGRAEPGIAPLPSSGRADLNAGRDGLNATRGDLTAGRNDLGRNDLGRNDLGRNDLGRNDLGRNDLGRNDLGRNDLGRDDLAESDNGGHGARQDLYGAPVAMPFRSAPVAPPATDDPVTRNDVGHGRPLPQNEPATRNDAGPPPSALPSRGRPGPADYPGRGRPADEPAGYGPPSPQDQFRGEGMDPQRGPATAQPGPFRRSPSNLPPAPPGAGQAGPGGAGGFNGPGGPNGPVGPVPPGPSGRPGALGPGQLPQGSPGGQLPSGPPAPQPYIPAQNGPQNGPYSGPQPTAPGRQSSGAPVSLTDAVQSAHEEGKDFGESVAREAPALWLEAVLARKPRMPSDLEARLLQGSALPIDFLLHDEVRHALRRGFWDALEGSRR
jgi:NYN domain